MVLVLVLVPCVRYLASSWRCFGGWILYEYCIDLA